MEHAQKYVGELIKFIIQIVVFIFAVNNFVVTKIDDAVALEKRLTRIEVQLESLNKNLNQPTSYNQ